MKKAGKILIAAVLSLFVSCVFVGCGAAGIDLVSYSDGELYHYELCISVSTEKRNDIERTAAFKPYSREERWTVSEWVRVLTENMGFKDGSRFEYVSEATVDGYFVMNYERVFDPSFYDDEEDDGETDENYKVERKNYFYVYETVITASNPFNGYRAQYDGAKEGEGSLMSIIKYGIKINVGGGSFTVLPALTEAFPALEGANLDLLSVSYSIPAGSVGFSSGETVRINGSKFYRFERLLDDEELTLTYSYLSPNAYGWYITIIAIGALTVGLILLATTKKKKKVKPSDKDMFPYDPFDENKHKDNLPSGYNDGGFRF